MRHRTNLPRVRARIDTLAVPAATERPLAGRGGKGERAALRARCLSPILDLHLNVGHPIAPPSLSALRRPRAAPLPDRAPLRALGTRRMSPLLHCTRVRSHYRCGLKDACPWAGKRGREALSAPPVRRKSGPAARPRTTLHAAARWKWTSISMWTFLPRCPCLLALANMA